MDIATIAGSKEALFADIMASSSENPRRRSKMSVVKRERDISKPRPVSMSVFPASSAYSGGPVPADRCNGGRGSLAGFLSRGFFARPKAKAFFSSEQHLPGRVEGYNQSREQLYQLKASQVRKHGDLTHLSFWFVYYFCGN